jgi:hypothetical protein
VENRRVGKYTINHVAADIGSGTPVLKYIHGTTTTDCVSRYLPSYDINSDKGATARKYGTICEFMTGKSLPLIPQALRGHDLRITHISKWKPTTPGARSATDLDFKGPRGALKYYVGSLHADQPSRSFMFCRRGQARCRFCASPP